MLPSQEYLCLSLFTFRRLRQRRGSLGTGGGDVTAVDALPVAALLPGGKLGAAPLVGVVGVLGGVGVELLLEDTEEVDMKGRLIFRALFSRSSGITADSSSLLSVSFFTSNAKSTILQTKTGLQLPSQPY